MTRLQPLLDRNREFAATGARDGLGIMPRHPVFLVTCLDPRVDPAAFLGIGLGDAPAIRNAGGRVTEDVLDEIAFIGQLVSIMRTEGPLFEVCVVHHTNCQTALLANDDIRSAYAATIGRDEADLLATAVLDPAATVRADVERLLASPKVPARASVSGHVYDLETGVVTTIVDERRHG